MKHENVLHFFINHTNIISISTIIWQYRTVCRSLYCYWGQHLNYYLLLDKKTQSALQSTEGDEFKHSCASKNVSFRKILNSLHSFSAHPYFANDCSHFCSDREMTRSPAVWHSLQGRGISLWALNAIWPRIPGMLKMSLSEDLTSGIFWGCLSYLHCSEDRNMFSECATE